MNDSQLYLLANVEIDADNEFTIDFDSATAQQTYFQSKISDVLDTTGDFSYIRKDADVKVEKSLEDLLSVNYLMFKNDSKWWYARITNKEYISPTTTRIYFEIDAFQTFMFDFEIQESFIDREHQDRFLNSLATPIYNTENEDVDYGSNYEIQSIVELPDNNTDNLDLYWEMLVCTESINDLHRGGSSADPTTWKRYDPYYKQAGVEYGVFCYIIPHTKKSKVAFYTPDYDGSDIRLFDFMYYQSTAILSRRILAYCPVNYNLTKMSDTKYRIEFDGGYKYGQIATTRPSCCMPIEMDAKNWGGVDTTRAGYRFISLGNIEGHQKSEIGTITKKTYSGTISQNNLKNIQFETKLFTHPYYFYLLNDYRTEPLILKNEHINQTLNIKIVQSCGVLQKSKVWAENYLGDENGKEYNTINNGIDEMPLKNEAYAQYMAQNKASATTGVAVSVGASILQAGIGVATGGIGAVVGIGQALSIGQQIAGEMIKRQDLKDTPDSIRKQGNNIEFDIVDNNIHQKVTTKQTTKMSKLYDYFFHYGYKANAFKKPDYRSRYYFNYLKTIGVNIKSNIDSIYVNELKSMFNNGVTIWHYRNSTTWKGTNNYDYENAEMNLISTEVENG